MTAETKSFERHRSISLDGLRGIAIALVLALHLIVRPNARVWQTLLGDPIVRVLDMSWCGVDLFFVLSGFLIGGIVFDNRHAKNFYVTFYVRRTARIWPIYFLLLGLACLPLGPFGAHLEATPVPLAAYATFTANLFTAAGNVPSFWFGPLWSICIEEQFYIVAPLLLRRASPRAVPWLLIAIVTGSAVLRTAWSLGWMQHSLSIWDFTLTRLDGLGLGVLGAWLIRQRGFIDRATARKRQLQWLLAALIGVCLWFSQQAIGLLLGPGIFFLSLTALVAILLVELDARSRLAGVLSVRPLRSLGQYSYFIYVFHMPVLAVCSTLLLRYDSTAPFVTVATLATVGALAVVSWRYFESPLLRLGRSIPYESPSPASSAPKAAAASEIA